MASTLPPPGHGPEDPRTVEVTLTDLPADLFKVVFWLGQVTDGRDPAEALRVIGLAAIKASSWSGRGYRAALTLELTEVT